MRYWTIVCCHAVAVSVIAGFPQASAEQERPNVLFLAVDDMNDWVGCLGGYAGQVHTPHMDRLAGQGMLFANAHCAAPVCNPSRTAVLTGLRPTTTGVYDNGRWWRPALPDAVTMPEYFSRHGYHVAGAGKVYHHTPGFNPPGQWDEYFDQVFDDPWHRPGPGDAFPVRGTHWPKGFPLCNLENVRVGRRPPANPKEFDWGPLQKNDQQMGDGQAVAWATEFLGRRHDEPFFLAVGIFRPHLPWYAPKKYFDLYPLEQVELPEVPAHDLDDVPAAGRKIAAYRGDEWEYLKEQRQWAAAVQAYLASISFADAMVGKIVAALDESRYSDNTIIVLWSDHGWHLGEKHHWHKFTLWEEATRVPLVVVAPAVTQKQTRTNAPAGLIDLYPTLVDLCRLPPKDDLDGESLKPWLIDGSKPRERPALTTHGPGNHSLRTERYRYIRYDDGSDELYDHQTDPHEWKNLARNPDHAETIARLANWLPRNEAKPAPSKAAYKFDPKNYEWKRRVKRGPKTP